MIGVGLYDSAQLSPTHRYPPKILYPPSGSPRQINSVGGEDKSNFLESLLGRLAVMNRGGV